MKYSGKGILGTALFHLLILLIFIYFGFTTPLPLPAEQGIVINFGDTDVGMGKTETSYQESTVASSESSNEKQNEQEYLTQDSEEAPAINVKKESTVTKKKNSDTEKNNEKKVTTETKPKEEERKVNLRALYRGNSDEPSNSDGTSNREGNQGSETGDPNSTDYYSGLSSGEGGISYSLTGRNPQYLAKPRFTQQEEGIVVVEITVDREGNVTNATPGVKGSTTLNSYLLNEAKRAALESKFNREPGSPAFQKGTVTYRFILK